MKSDNMQKDVEREHGDGVVQQVARYAEKTLGEEGFRYTSAVVANCRMLAIQQLDDESETRDGDETHEEIDMDALVIAGYMHDISTVAYGYNDHQRESARMAVAFLQQQHYPQERIARVEQAILQHATHTLAEQRATVPVEARILYDADRLGRLSGLSVVTSLIEFGARYPDRAMTSEVLTAVLRHIEERFIDLYQSLYTESAREMAREKFGKTLAFLDGVIEHISEATPI
jgi:HD superfamily phosphodiesterase